MKDFLTEDVRDKALRVMREIRRERFARAQKQTTHKRSNSRHKLSPYLLTGKLEDQSGEKLTGVEVGRAPHKQRRYRHKRGRRECILGSAYAKTLHADTMEQAVLKILIEALSDETLIRSLIQEAIQQDAADPTEASSDDLVVARKQRKAELQKNLQHIVLTFDAAAMAAVKEQVDAMSRELAGIAAQLEEAQIRKNRPALDPQMLTEQTLTRFRGLAESLANALIVQLRQAIDTFVEKVVIDMETQEFSVFLRIPEPQVMCPVDTSPSPTRHQTPPEVFLRLVEADCKYVRHGKLMPTCDCRRRPRRDNRAA